MLLKKRGKQFRQIFRQTRGVGEQMHARLQAARKSLEIAPHGFDIVDDDPGMAEQVFSRRGQFDATPAALEKRDPKRLFHRLDPRACRWQREMHARSAMGDAAVIGHRDEQAKIDQIELHGDSRKG